MADILIRDVPEDVVATIDGKAKRLGLSRTEYLRRVLRRATYGSDDDVTIEDLRRVADTFADARDPAIMARAWR